MLNLMDSYVKQIEPVLAKKLGQAESLADAGRAVQDAIAPLLDPTGDFLGDLLIGQADVVRDLFGMIYQTGAILREATTTEMRKVAPPSGSAMENTRSNLLAAGASAIATRFIPMLAGPVVGTALGFGLALLYGKLRQSDDGNVLVEITTLSPETIQCGIKELLGRVERVANNTVMQPPAPEKTLDGFHDVIDMLHDVISAGGGAEDDQLAPAALKGGRVIKLLGRYGVECKTYIPTDDGSGPDEALWRVDVQDDCGPPRTLAPALIHRGKVLRTGRVLMPRVSK